MFMGIRPDYEQDIINAQNYVINYLLSHATLRDGQYRHLIGKLNNIERLKGKRREQKDKDSKTIPD